MSDFASKVVRIMDEKQMPYRELSDKTGVSKPALQRYMTGVTDKIPMDVVEKVASALGVTAAYLMGWTEPDEMLKIKNILPIQMEDIPLVGQIACGQPITAEENIEGYVKSDISLHADYALRCKGDSMIDANIHDGDLVYIRQADDVNDGEATLKRVFRDGKQLVLQAENKLFRPLVYTEADARDIRIIGRAVAVLSLVK